MSKYLEAKTKYDVQVNVCKSYLMAASTQMNLDLIRSNIKAVEKTLNDVKALNKEGFTEDLDVKRLQLSLNNLKVQEKKIENAIETLMNILKIQMGIDVSQKISLSDDIEKINTIFTVDVNGEISLNSTQNRPEFNILKQSIRLGELDKKRYQMGMLPRLVGFYQHQENTQRPEFNFFKDQNSLTINNSWVPSDVVGLQIQWTLFDGLSTVSKIREVKYKTDKAKTDLAAFSNAAFAEALNAQNTYINQLDQAASQKQNMDLAQEIYKMANMKFTEGVGSSLEIVQSETELKNAQINYLNALYDLVLAKIDYQKSLGLGINF
jgi:outer membrane protein TolC